MQRFLTIYLAVTGIGAFLALLMPGLVVLGFFLLIVPGLLLSLAPTAFLWGAIFAVVWWLCRSAMADLPAALAALAVTAAILFAIPWPSRVAGQRLLAASVVPDVTPAAALKPAGNVRLDLGGPRWDNKNPPVSGAVRAFACDNLCLALLFEPGVTSVTVNDSGPFAPEQHRGGGGAFATGAQTYRLMPKDQCAGREIVPDIEGRVGLFGGTLEEMRAVDAEWKLKLATEYCVVREPPIRAFDFFIREGRFHEPADGPRSAGEWSLQRSAAEISYVEIRSGSGTVLLRRLVSRVSVLARPFSITPEGGIENFRFGWSRKRLSNAKRYAEVDLLELLKAHSTLGRARPAADLVPQIRKRLQQALADPAVPGSDPSFGTLEVYFAGIGAGRLDAEDMALVKALVLDERLASYPGLHHLNTLPPDQHREIGATIVRRILATRDVQALIRSRLGTYLGQSPEGALAALSSEERRLLESPERRVAAADLVARLADGGAATTPLLLDILRHHGAALAAALASRERDTDRSQRIHTHAPMLNAARIAFCRLGPAAAPALPAIEAMIADGTIPAYSVRGHEGTAWNLMMMRLGKPVETIRKPESLSGSEANYRRNMAGRLSRFDPERSCGRV
ncbi:MAG TPA: hypothetical protein VF727_16560 [Allosphingosinicella sp.]|jgi:hypothetical protein